MSIIAGIGWHMVGAASAASFYAPIDKVRNWSWETTWAVAGLFSWILLPIGVSALLLPDFGAFYARSSDCVVEGGSVRRDVGHRQCELRPDHALPGHVAGDRRRHRRDTGGRHAGAALPAWAGSDLSRPRRLLNMAGVLVALMGVAIVSYAGHQKENSSKTGEPTEFNVMLGLGWR